MQVPLQITFRNIETSEKIEAEIRNRVDKLTSHHPEIISCHIVVEAPAVQQQKGGVSSGPGLISAVRKESLLSTGNHLSA